MSNYPFPDNFFPSRNNMTRLSWNVRGAANAHFNRTVRHFVQQHNPDILLLTETRVSQHDADEILDDLPLHNWVISDTVGFKGGIWLLYNEEAVEITVLATTAQEIHVMVSSPGFL